MSNPIPTAGLPLRISLWTAQLLLAAIYVPAGLMKLFSPVAEVAQQIPWAGDVPELFLRAIGMVDLAAGLGLLLPALTRIMPRLTLMAATGSIALQLLALIFHGMRGEMFVIPFNLVIIALSAFVLWGRANKAPITARSATASALQTR